MQIKGSQVGKQSSLWEDFGWKVVQRDFSMNNAQVKATFFLNFLLQKHEQIVTL
jgi:hypothetical protein